MEDQKTAVLATHSSASQTEHTVDARASERSSKAATLAPLTDQGIARITHGIPSQPSAGSIGAAVAGAIGGTFGLVAGVAAIAIPGLGSLIATGTIRAALAGLGVGGLVGWLVVALRSGRIGRRKLTALRAASAQAGS